MTVAREKKLVALIEEKEAALKILEDELDLLEKRLAVMRCPFQVGDRIRWGEKRSKMLGTVCGVEGKRFYWLLRVTAILKDGSNGADYTVRPSDNPVKEAELNLSKLNKGVER